jgi:hypothetical protein
MGLAYLFVVGILIQVFLAGFGIFGDFDEDLDPHREFGFIVLHIIPILMFVAALVGRMRWTFIGLTVFLFVIVFLQPLWLDPEDDDISNWVNAVHPTMAIVMFALGHFLAQKSMQLVRGQAVLGAEPAA